MKRGLQTIVFANSRLHTEVLLTYLKQDNPQPPGIAGDRAGLSRRLSSAGEAGDRARTAQRADSGSGGHQCSRTRNRHRFSGRSRHGGIPGHDRIDLAARRAGRDGEREHPALCWSRPPVRWINSSSSIRTISSAGSPEHAYIQPDNLEILVNHLKCAAFELPLESGEAFGEVDLAAALRTAGGSRLSAPQRRLSGTGPRKPIRPTPSASGRSPRTISSSSTKPISRKSSAKWIFPARSPRCIPRPSTCTARSNTTSSGWTSTSAKPMSEESTSIISPRRYATRRSRDSKWKNRPRSPGPAVKAHGDVQVRSQVVGFKKIKFYTLENVGSGKLELPENEMHTTAYWITLGRELLDSLPFTISERQDGLFGLLYALESIASLLLMCDRMDLGATIGEGMPEPEAAAGDPPKAAGFRARRANFSSRRCTCTTRIRAASA